MNFEKPSAYKNISSAEIRTTKKNEFKEVIVSREEFQDLLNENNTVIVFKFGATWCTPCQAIKSHVKHCVSKLPNNICCLELDVDDSFDLYAYLKSKKQVNGIPCLLAYKSGNTSFAPDSSISGTNLENITSFFNNLND
jgi:thiol-disulfide isomerase/thioredoxin